MLFVITNPEDMMDSLPIVTPGYIVELAPIKLFFEIQVLKIFYFWVVYRICWIKMSNYCYPK